jgi:TraM recognition site of TraD and TraG
MRLYIDELASFATDKLPSMLSEARKFGLGLCTANQSLDQLRNRSGQPTIGRAILANSATKIMMRLGPFDTELLSPYYKPQFSDAAMAMLPDMHAVASMHCGGRPLAPFIFRTSRPVHDPAVHATPDSVIAGSNIQYARPVKEVNAMLANTYEIDIDSLQSRG